jgi:hypothetical protein
MRVGWNGPVCLSQYDSAFEIGTSIVFVCALKMIKSN